MALNKIPKNTFFYWIYKYFIKEKATLAAQCNLTLSRMKRVHENRQSCRYEMLVDFGELSITSIELLLVDRLSPFCLFPERGETCGTRKNSSDRR